MLSSAMATDQQMILSAEYLDRVRIQELDTQLRHTHLWLQLPGGTQSHEGRHPCEQERTPCAAMPVGI